MAALTCLRAEIAEIGPTIGPVNRCGMPISCRLKKGIERVRQLGRVGDEPSVEAHHTQESTELLTGDRPGESINEPDLFC